VWKTTKRGEGSQILIPKESTRERTERLILFTCSGGKDRDRKLIPARRDWEKGRSTDQTHTVGERKEGLRKCD